MMCKNGCRNVALFYLSDTECKRAQRAGVLLNATVVNGPFASVFHAQLGRR